MTDIQKEMLRCFTSYGNAMYRKDPESAERLANRFQEMLDSIDVKNESPHQGVS